MVSDNRPWRGLPVLLLLFVAFELEGAGRRRAVRHPGGLVLRFTSGDRLAQAENSSAINPAAAFTLEMRLWQAGDVRGTISPVQRRQGRFDLYGISIVNPGDGTEYVQFSYIDGKDGYIITGERVGMPRRRWVHVALVLDGVVARAYVDGALYATEGMEGMGKADSTAEPLRIGERFPGAVRDLRIWHRAMPANEIAAIANGGDPLTNDGLAAFWPFNDGPTQTPKDIGPNNIKLTLGNSLDPDDLDGLWTDSSTMNIPAYWDLRFMPVRNVRQGPVFAVDATGDGLPDLGVYNGADATRCEFPYYDEVPTSIAFRNTGNGFVEDPSIVVYQMSGFDRHIRIADMTNDGRPDVMIVDHGPEYPAYNEEVDCGPPGVDASDLPGGVSRLLVASPDGKLREQTLERLPRRVAYDHAYAIIDVDNDKDLDLYLGGRNNLDPGTCKPADRIPGSPCPVILINDGSGYFTEDFTRLPESIASHRDENDNQRYYTAALPIDADRDGDQDLVMGGWSHNLSDLYDLLLLNDGTGHFTKSPPDALPIRDRDGHSGTIYMDTADFDLDGWPDILTIQNGTYLYRNQHNGTFRKVEGAFPAHAETEEGRCSVADLNADGAADVLCPSRGVTSAPYPRRLPMALYFNRGDGTFEEMLNFDDLGEGDRVYAVDADGDGDLDLMGNHPYFWVAYQVRPYVPGRR